MVNFFHIFALEERYDIDLAVLDSKYFELLAKFHPDKAATTKDQQEYLSHSMLINNGYKALQDDFERAAHILKIHEIDIKNDELAPKLPAEILEQILEIRERLESSDDKSKIYKEQHAAKKVLINELRELFASGNYQAASVKAMQLKYVNNLLVE